MPKISGLMIFGFFTLLPSWALANPPESDTKCQGTATRIEESNLEADRADLRKCLSSDNVSPELKVQFRKTLEEAERQKDAESQTDESQKDDCQKDDCQKDDRQKDADRRKEAQKLIKIAMEGPSPYDSDELLADYLGERADGIIVNKGGSGKMTDQAVEFFSILADVAVKRAKRNGLAALQDRLAKTVCSARFEVREGKHVLSLESTVASEGIVLFPSTCALLEHTSLERIAGEPEVLAATVAGDLTEVFASLMIKRATGNDQREATTTVASMLTLTREVVARTLKTKNFSIQSSDVRLILNTIIVDHLHHRTKWGREHKALVVGVGALAYVVTGNDDPAKWARTDVASLVAQLCPLDSVDDALSCTATLQFEATKLAGLGIKAYTAVNDAGYPDVTAQAKAAVQLVFAIAAAVAICDESKKILAQVETLLVSTLDRDVPRSLSAAATLMQSCCLTAPDSDTGIKYDLQDLVTLLSSIATYSSTYITLADDETPPSPEELRAARTAALESAIDAFTDRHNRHGDWVGSLGLPVGFSLGGQSLNSDGLRAHELMLPQLSLPLGLAIQRLPGKRHREGKRPNGSFFFDGFHAMVTAVDLGQFVAYDAGGAVSNPTWSSFMSLGGQLGWLIGSPANAFVIAADVRYAPSLFPDDDPQTQTSGAIRFGVFLAYHVSLFDFN